MKKSNLILMFFALAVSLSSCQIIGGIFKAGVWVGVLLVVFIVAIVIWLLSKLGGSGKE